MNTSKRIGGTINNWYMYNNRVSGTVVGDSHWPDDTPIHTSSVVNLTKDTLETLNTVYKLGPHAFKLYIVVRSDVPDHMVPVLVAHTVLKAHIEFEKAPWYQVWLEQSFKKVVVKANPTQFKKLVVEYSGITGQANTPCGVTGYENTVHNAETTCLIPMVVHNDTIPKALRRLRLWKPSHNEQNSLPAVK